ncbi:MAG: hypothetical protein AAGA91_19955, partial [Pseudomonadota bacterium]
TSLNHDGSEGGTMTMDDVLAVFKSVTGVAHITNTCTQAVSTWKRYGVPDSRQYELYVKSQGKLIPEGFDPEVDYIALALSVSGGKK